MAKIKKIDKFAEKQKIVEIKGTSLKSTLNYIEENFYDRKEEWLSNLPARSRELFTNPLLATNWYPVDYGLIIPTEVTGKLFFDGNSAEASFRIGMHSAKEGLRGVYKIFLKMASTDFVLSRAPRIISLYYKDSKITYEKPADNSAILTLEGFSEKEKLIFDRTKGWIHQTLLLLNKQPQEIKYFIENTAGDFILCKMNITWQ